MKKSLVSILIASVFAVLGFSDAVAQDGGPHVVPVDIFSCKYNEGKGPADLDAAVDAWNAFMDESGNDSYAAWTMTKHYYGPDQDFDFAWLGAWSDGNAMGAGMDNFYNNGGEVAAGFAAVADCNGTGNFASIRHRAPAGGTPADSVILFWDCKLADGVSNAMMGEKMKEWSAALDDAGMTQGMFHWFPVFGGGGEPEFDFKSIAVFENHTEFGKMYQAMTNGGLAQTRNAIFGDVVDCDLGRAYNAELRRAANIRGD